MFGARVIVALITLIIFMTSMWCTIPEDGGYASMSNDDDLIYEGDSGSESDYGVLNESRVVKRARLDPALVRIAKYKSKRSDWVITKSATGFCDVHHKVYKQIKVTVSPNRVNKAMEKLDPVNLNGVLFKNNSCNCSKNCNLNTLNFADVLQARTKLFGNPDNSTEQKLTSAAVELLRSRNPGYQPNSDVSLKYAVPDTRNHFHPVCSRFWASVYGLCESKMRTVRLMAKNNSREIVHGRKGKESGLLQHKKSDYAYAFWKEFFDDCCQRPTDSIRLFPVNKPYETIYDEYFVHWFRKLSSREDLQLHDDEKEWMPSLSTFKKARKHDDFEDVKRRPKHYHARCGDCAELNNIRLRGFVNDVHKKEWKLRFQAHEHEARQWHVHEEAQKNTSRAAMGQKTLVLGYDDTSALELPKFTNREIKNGTMSKLQVIPFNITNYTSGETAYVYTLKNRYPKGANRLCTVLYHYLRKVKFGDHPCRHARTLVLQADNFSENKNNPLFMFCCELVTRGWFDEVYLEFGPPGHTHNGTDAVHRIHNRVAGNYQSGTLGEFQSMWVHSWRKDFSMPTAVLNDSHLDWTERYRPYERRIAGCFSGGSTHESCRAFKIHWSPRGDGVEVLFKPTVADARWLGCDHQPETPGFFMLSQVPPSRPKALPGGTRIMTKRHIREMVGKNVQRQLASYQGEQDAQLTCDWLRDCATNGYIPYTLCDESKEVPKGSWGPEVSVGIPGRTGKFYVMQDSVDDTDVNFWKLPDDIQAYVDQATHDLMAQRTQLLGTPNVRYADQSPAAAREMQANAAVAVANRESRWSDEKSGNDTVDSVMSNAVGGENDHAVENLGAAFDQFAGEPAVRQWGVDFDQCIATHHAVAHDEFEDGEGGSGINVYKIAEVHAVGDSDQPNYFTTTTKFVPSKAGLSVTDPACLAAPWHRQNCEETKVKGWQVVYYFKKFTKERKIPKHKKVLDVAEAHGLELFRPPDTREFPQILRDETEESDESGSDN